MSRMNAQVRAEATIEALDRTARRAETPCGDGVMVWRVFGAGAPVILLHGGSGSWLHWIKTIPELSSEYELWVPDLPGLGDSALPPPPLTPATCGEVVADGVRRLFAPDVRPHLVTFSFGAHVGAFAAAALGNRLRSFLICGCAALGLPHLRRDFVKEHVRMTAPERADVHRANLATLMIADPQRIDDLAIHIQAVNIAKARFRSRAFASGDEIRRQLPHIKIPLRSIWGANDQIALPSVEARLAVLREHHPKLIARVIPDAGHWVAYEQAEAFNRALHELLATPAL